MKAHTLRGQYALHRNIVCGSFLLCACVQAGNVCPPRYAVTTITETWAAPNPPGYWVRSFAINNSGTVVGTLGEAGGFKWNTSTGLVLLAGNVGEGGGVGGCLAINDDGWVGGRYRFNSGDADHQFPALWSPTGVVMQLQQGGSNQEVGGRVAGMNSQLVLVGTKYLHQSFNRPAVSWQTPTSFPHFYDGCIPFPSAVEYEDALGVNDSNRIVGFTYSCPSPGTLRASFRDTPTGIPTSINLLPGDTVSRATAVNNPGFIVGYSGVDPDFASAHAFLRTLDGNVAALGSIPGGPVSSFAFAISANSEIVGGTAIAPTGVAWRWTPEGGMVDINTLLASPSPEWVVAEARGVNESGQMAVTLRRVSDGFLRLARLDPIASCAADFDCDGVVNSADFFSFLTAFFSDAPAADFNHDFVINSADFFEFLAAFFAGC